MLAELPAESFEEALLSFDHLSKLSDPDVLLPEEALEVFNWREVKSKGIETREGATLVKHASGLILFGGLNRQKHNEVHQFSLTNLEWKSLSTLYTPKERSGHSAVSYKHKMIVYGGCGDYSSRSAQRRCDKKVNILSLKNFKWQVFDGKGHQPRGRRNHAACRLGKFLVVVGGIDKFSRSLSSCYSFNLKSHEWMPLPDVPFEVSHSSLTPVYPGSIVDLFTFDILAVPTSPSSIAKRGLYLYGGLGSDGKVNQDVWVFNTAAENMWKKLETSGKPPTARHSHTADLLKKYLIVFGGRNDSVFASSKDLVRDFGVLDVWTLTWQTINFQGDVPKARWGHCSSVFENKLIVFGGIDYKHFMESSLFYMNIEKSL
jgi:N-acetylneuraminic acid mutarotase